MAPLAPLRLVQLFEVVLYLEVKDKLRSVDSRLTSMIEAFLQG